MEEQRGEEEEQEVGGGAGEVYLEEQMVGEGGARCTSRREMNGKSRG